MRTIKWESYHVWCVIWPLKWTENVTYWSQMQWKSSADTLSPTHLSLEVWEPRAGRIEPRSYFPQHCLPGWVVPSLLSKLGLPCPLPAGLPLFWPCVMSTCPPGPHPHSVSHSVHRILSEISRQGILAGSYLAWREEGAGWSVFQGLGASPASCAALYPASLELKATEWETLSWERTSVFLCSSWIQPTLVRAIEWYYICYCFVITHFYSLAVHECGWCLAVCFHIQAWHKCSINAVHILAEYFSFIWTQTAAEIHHAVTFCFS